MKKPRGSLYKKNGYYIARITYYVGDKRKTKDKSTGIPVGGCGKNNPARQRDKANRFLATWMASFVPPEEQVADIKDQLLTDTAKEWLEHQRGLKAPGTLASYQRCVKDIILYFDSFLPVKTAQLTSIQVEQYLAWERMRRQPEYSGDYKIEPMYSDGSGVENTVLHRATVLRSILQYAKKNGIVDKNVAAKHDCQIDLPKPQRHDFPVLDTEEAKQLLQKVEESATWFQVAVTLALTLGLRRSEIIGLKSSDFDLNLRILRITRTVTQQTLDGKNTIIAKPFTKNRKPKEFTLSEGFCNLIKTLILEHEQNRESFGLDYNIEWDSYLMRYPDGRLISPNRLTQEFKRFIVRNKFKNIRFHDLRHSCASILLAHGVDILTIQEILGHTQLSTTMMYTHPINNLKNIALAKMDSLMSGTADKEEPEK